MDAPTYVRTPSGGLTLRRPVTPAALEMVRRDLWLDSIAPDLGDRWSWR